AFMEISARQARDDVSVIIWGDL
ncbi:hypothetical protein A2U01_0105099, partial [Trifolium medium]|nr:hypothetical protein [Trifolium medium]